MTETIFLAEMFMMWIIWFQVLLSLLMSEEHICFQKNIALSLLSICFFAMINYGLTQFLEEIVNTDFPASLTGMIGLFTILIISDMVNPKITMTVQKFLQNGAQLLANWLALFFAPALVALPRLLPGGGGRAVGGAAAWARLGAGAALGWPLSLLAAVLLARQTMKKDKKGKRKRGDSEEGFLKLQWIHEEFHKTGAETGAVESQAMSITTKNKGTEKQNHHTTLLDNVLSGDLKIGNNAKQSTKKPFQNDKKVRIRSVDDDGSYMTKIEPNKILATNDVFTRIVKKQSSSESKILTPRRCKEEGETISHNDATRVMNTNTEQVLLPTKSTALRRHHIILALGNLLSSELGLYLSILILLGMLAIVVSQQDASCCVEQQFAHFCRNLFLLVLTATSFWTGREAPNFVKSKCHPLVTCTLLTLVGCKSFALCTNETLVEVLKSYQTDSQIFSMMGAGDWLLYMLSPAIVSLSSQIFQHRVALAQNCAKVMVTVLGASFFGLFSSALLASALKMNPHNGLALLSRQVTSPLAMIIAEHLGADSSLAIFLVVFSGILGANFAIPLLNFFRISNPTVRGLAVGASAHGIGTAALVAEPEAFSLSAIAMALVATVSTLLVFIPPIKDALYQVISL